MITYAYILLGFVIIAMLLILDIPDMYRQFKNLKGQK